MDEKQAIRGLKRGDIGGLEVLVTLYQVRAVRTAYLITGEAALAEDVTQEAFLQAYRSIRHFDQVRPFSPWFMRIVVHTAVKAAQRYSRQVYPIPSLGKITLAPEWGSEVCFTWRATSGS
jgi:DNA-directed RNA polymerase specialized sigma24 family protein